MKNFSLILSLCIASVLVGYSQPRTGNVPMIDLTKQYPKKDILLQEIANVAYISLNGKDAPLIGRPSIGYVSQECLILYDIFTGDVFVLGKDGNCRSHFNQKGNSGKEYLRIDHLTYDPKKREIYILDAFGTNGILVYTETGKFVRSFPEQSRQYIQEIYDFDEQTLLAYCMPSRIDANNPNHTNPYLFLSKQDGKIDSRLNLHFRDRHTSKKSIPTDAGALSIVIWTSDYSTKYGNEFVIADISADTLYSLFKGRSLTPILTRTPSIQRQNPLIAWSVGLKTDQFILISASEYDFEAIKKAAMNNRPAPQQKPNSYLFYIKNHEIVTPNFINTDWSSKSASVGMRQVSMDEKNMSVTIIYAEKLTAALEKGELKGKLKEVAQTLTPDDNPVLMVVTFR